MKRFYPLLLLCCAFLHGTPTAFAQVSLGVINAPYTQNFDSLASSGLTNEMSTLPLGWAFSETGTNANTTYAAGTGSSNAGNTYSFGLTASDRALGGLQSGSLIPVIGASFVNNTGTTITSLEISCHGEQWRLGASGRGADVLNFQYSTTATSLNTGTWTDADALDFQSPVTVGTAGALNGNDPLNRTALSAVITGLAIEPGAVFYIRWTDFNVSSSDDGLAIDDVTLTPIGVPSNMPSITFIPAQLNFGDVNINTADTLQYQVVASNLTDSIAVFNFYPSYTLSSDGFTFGSSVVLPDSGGLVYVRFAPTTNGIARDSIVHSGGAVTTSLHVTGNGFDQASNIIPISFARSKPAGEKVTVAGRITTAFELGNPAYIQDATGGIPVFDFALASSVEIGDSVIVTGPIGIFNDQKQISGTGIFFTVINTPKRFIAPEPITIDELAAHEGLLVTVQGIELVNKDFVFYPQSTERITNGVLAADLRIDGDTDIPGLAKPQGIFDVTGVVGRFRTNAQLLPRFRQDIPGAHEPVAPSDSISKNKTLDIVTWNLEFFGARREDYTEEYGPADEALQLLNVRRVLDSLKADIIAVEEVSNDSLFGELVSNLGKYKASCSDRYSYSFEGPSNTFPPQKVCFIYDTTTVDVLSTKVLFEELYDSARTGNPSLLPGYPGGSPSSFYSSGRLPFLLTANATIEGVTTRISLVVLHAKSGATVADRARRVYDAQVLKDSLDTFYPDEKLIILGDLNDDLDQSIVTGQPSSYQNFVMDTARYIPVTKTLSDAGARSTVSFNDVIDHQIISNELGEEYLTGSAQINTPFTLIANYASTTSDHLPVITRYALQAPVVSFVQSGATLTEDSASYEINLTISKASPDDRQISIALNGNALYGDDYNTTPAAVNGQLVLTLPAGSTTASFSVTIINDVWDELTEVASFALQSSDGLVTGTPSEFALTIEDNDVPVISFAALLSSGKEGAGDHAIKLKLSAPPASSQTVTIQVYNGPGAVYNNDYTTEPSPGNNRIHLSIAPGSTEASFTLTPTADAKREFPELVTFYLAEVSSGLMMAQPRISVFTILDVRKREPHVAIFPNPTSSTARLICQELERGEVIQAELRNGFGEMLYSGSGTLEQVNEAIAGKLQSGRKGIYIVKVILDGETYNLRLLKI
jgi:hypothetical protein